jgi:hypothetical protein
MRVTDGDMECSLTGLLNRRNFKSLTVDTGCICSLSRRRERSERRREQGRGGLHKSLLSNGHVSLISKAEDHHGRGIFTRLIKKIENIL